MPKAVSVVRSPVRLQLTLDGVSLYAFLNFSNAYDHVHGSIVLFLFFPYVTTSYCKAQIRKRYDTLP